MVKKSILCLPFVTCARRSENAPRTRQSAVTYSDDGCHELNKEVGDLQQGREEMIQKVDEKSLDMRTVVILSVYRQQRLPMAMTG